MTTETTAPKAPGLNSFIDFKELQKDVAINLADLDTAMMTQASMLVHYARMTIDARKQYEKAKTSAEIMEARLDDEHRTALKTENPKTTENAIKAAVITDARYVGAQARMIEAQSIWKMCEIAESALSTRKDMILELARDRRKEREGELRVMAQDAAEKAVASRMTNVIEQLRRQAAAKAA